MAKNQPQFIAINNFFDPYLSWAKLTNYQGFSDVYTKKPVSYLIALERLDSDLTNPFPVVDKQTYPNVGLRAFTGNEKFFIGNAGDVATVEKLAADINYRVELNMTRYRPIDGAGSRPLEFAPKPDLGKKVVAIIDYGCPFAHRQFHDKRKHELNSRIKYFWDQEASKTAKVFQNASLDGVWWFPVKDHYYGREITQPLIARLMQSFLTESGALDEDALYEACNYDTVSEPYSHGGVVMDLAAGNLNPRTGQPDAASEADIIFVQLPRSAVYDPTGSSMSVFLLDALNYIIDKCKGVEQLVINLSFGATAGPHNGQSLIERAMDDFLANTRKDNPFSDIHIVLAAGNHHEANLHANIELTKKIPKKILKWHVMPDDCTDSYVELWSKSDICDKFTVTLRSPSGKKTSPVTLGAADSFNEAISKKILAAVIRPSQYNRGQEKSISLIALAPTHASAWAQVEHGIWSIELELIDMKSSPVEIDAWIERDDPMAWEKGQPQSHFVSFSEHLSSSEWDAVYDEGKRTDAVSRLGTNSKLSNGALTTVVGSYIADTRVYSNSGRLKEFDLSPYSGAAPKQLAAGRTSWPDFVAIGDSSRSLDGILACGNRTGVVCSMNGTSVAAPQITRYLINQGSPWAVGALHPGLDFQTLLASTRGKSAKRLS